MKRTLLTAAIVLSFATMASGASLTLTSDAASYVVGDTITLSLSGDHTGETASGVYARVTYEAALTEFVSSGQTMHTTSFGNMNWTGNPDTSSLASDGAATLLNQIFLGGGADPSGMSSAQIVLVAEAAGVVNVAYITGGGGSALSYFGVTNAPGTSFSITEIPEPTVASLIGLGLVGLALGGRRRS